MDFKVTGCENVDRFQLANAGFRGCFVWKR